jgi:hypothetical protein
MVWNHRTDSIGGSPKHPAFAGILAQEYDARAGKLTGEPVNIFAGSRTGWSKARTCSGATAGTTSPRPRAAPVMTMPSPWRGRAI